MRHPMEFEGRVKAWLDQEAHGFDLAVEFGAGKFEKIAHVDAKIRVGIEICPDYIRDFCPPEVLGICADMRECPDTLVGADRTTLALLIDSLEHIEKADGMAMLPRLQRAFNKVLVFCPSGTNVQTEDPWGYDNPWQEHKSTWWPPDLEALGFRVNLIPDFHIGKGDAMFAVWP